ncbi:MAG: alcohol dehydrogenase [Dehalococcoidia bacterium]|nr:alcohol dehydrogenase [Dehalococcoidia bacterium]
MKATYLMQFGGPEVLQYGDLPAPSIGAGEVLIRVRATALNHLDVWRRSGQRGTKAAMDKPLVLGCDIAGEVAQAGASVKGLAAGDRVIVNPGITCGTCAYCQSARDNMCLGYTMIGSQADGGYAEYAKAPAENVHKVTAALSWAQLAAIPLTTLTAWHMLTGVARLRPSETVLIQAAGSGVGSSALQIAKLIGARAIVTAGTDEKLARAKEQGADEGINYQREDFAQRVKEMTGGAGVEVVFDHIGEATFEKNIASLAKGGRYVNCGVTSGHMAKLHIGQLFTKQVQLSGSFMGTKAEFREVVSLVNRGKLTGVVGREFALQDAAEAHRVMESRDFYGKLVLLPV